MFEILKERYVINWCTKDQLKFAVLIQVITAGQYKEICGEDYVA